MIHVLVKKRNSVLCMNLGGKCITAEFQTKQHCTYLQEVFFLNYFDKSKRVPKIHVDPLCSLHLDCIYLQLSTVGSVGFLHVGIFYIDLVSFHCFGGKQPVCMIAILLAQLKACFVGTLIFLSLLECLYHDIHVSEIIMACLDTLRIRHKKRVSQEMVSFYVTENMCM